MRAEGRQQRRWQGAHPWPGGGGCPGGRLAVRRPARRLATVGPLELVGPPEWLRWRKAPEPNPYQPRASNGARNRPVWERGQAAICSGGTEASTSPPRSPPSGPRSMTQSAVLMTSGLCSITTRVLSWPEQPVAGPPAGAWTSWEVQAGGGPVEQVEGAAGVAAGQLPGEIDPLGLATGQRGRGLAEAPHRRGPRPHQGLELAGRWASRERRGPGPPSHGQVQDLVDGLALVADLQGLAVVAAAPGRRRTGHRRRAGSASRPGSGRRPCRPRSARRPR